jgi:ABC-2 type transport system ATP-binding protein
MDIERELRTIAREMEKTVLLSTHDMKLVQDVCDDVVILDKGKIVADGTVENLLRMFRGMTYEFVLLNPISEEIKDYLLGLDYNFYFTKDDTVLETEISDSKEIYSIIDTLRAKSILVKEIKQKDVNFERVYLNFTRIV